MAGFAIICFLTGLAVGLQFRVLSLVPALSFMLAVVAVGGISHGETIWWTAGAMLLAALSTQLGYFGGTVLRFVMADGSRRERQSTEPRIIPTIRKLSGR